MVISDWSLPPGLGTHLLLPHQAHPAWGKPKTFRRRGISAGAYFDGLMQKRRNSIANALESCLFCINSSPPSAAHMRQWNGSALVQIMACHLFAPSHYLNKCWVIVYWTLRNKLQWNFNQNTKLFINENASENIVWETVAILSRGRSRLSHHLWEARSCSPAALEHINETDGPARNVVILTKLSSLALPKVIRMFHSNP